MFGSVDDGDHDGDYKVWSEFSYIFLLTNFPNLEYSFLTFHQD